jgi:hypothetical protein
MAFVHVCPLCEYSREAEHSTVLDPACPTCGGVLVPASEAAAPLPAPAISPLAMARRVARARWFDRTVTALVLTPLVLAATKLGWSAAGAGGGLGALLLACLAGYVAVSPATRGG